MKLATLVYVKHNGRTLMIHRVKKKNDFHEGKWNGLGGKFELGETPEECAIREVREEAGLEIRNPRLHGFITFPSFDGIEDWYVFLLTAHEFSGDLIDSPEGNLEWIDDDQVLSLNLWDGDRNFIPWLDQEKFFSAKFEYDKGKMMKYDVKFY